jgi:hypothetical protein
MSDKLSFIIARPPVVETSALAAVRALVDSNHLRPKIQPKRTSNYCDKPLGSLLASPLRKLAAYSRSRLSTYSYFLNRRLLFLKTIRASCQPVDAIDERQAD